MPTPRRWPLLTPRGTRCPQIREAAPQGMELKIDFDQSVFVRGAIEGVVREAILSSILVSLMILIFLGTWRSMVVVSTSIPLSIFAAIICLNLAGDSINIMTLGGLALAIGMLVDDATVAVENIHRNRALGKPLTVAVVDGSSADRGAGHRVHARHLRGLLPRRAALRRGKISLHAPGPGRGDVDACLLRAFADARARALAHAHAGRAHRDRDPERGAAAASSRSHSLFNRRRDARL